MYQTIVRDDVRNGEHAGVPLLGEHVTPGTGQCPVRRDQRVMHAMHPLEHRAGSVQVELGRRGTGQDAGLCASRHQLPYRWRVQLHVGVEVDSREGLTGRVAQAQRVRLARHRCFDDAYAVRLLRRLGGAVGAGVRDDDDVELAGRAAVEQPPQVPRDDRFLVVRRNDDADCGLAHDGQDSRYPLGRTR
jgi:hypothetical protein